MKIKILCIKICGCNQTVLRGKFIVLNVFMTKEEKLLVNNLYFYDMKFEPREQNELKGSRREDNNNTNTSRSQ